MPWLLQLVKIVKYPPQENSLVRKKNIRTSRKIPRTVTGTFPRKKLMPLPRQMAKDASPCAAYYSVSFRMAIDRQIYTHLRLA